MSALVYPGTLPGLTYDNVRTPFFKTGVQTAVSGKESRLAYMVYPLHYFELKYEWLDDRIATSHLKALAGLFMQMQGRADTFLFTDPAFSSVTDYQFGTGNGSTTAFQLFAAWQNSGGPGYPELVQNLNGAPTIKKAGVTQTTPANYTLGATGIVTFTSAPAAAAALTWTGSFYYRCRFDDDQMPLTQFMDKWWTTKTIKLRTIKL